MERQTTEQECYTGTLIQGWERNFLVRLIRRFHDVTWILGDNVNDDTVHQTISDGATTFQHDKMQL